MNEKQKIIMTAAIKLFAKKGFDATSIQEIADRSGISKGAFYLHFRSKEELVLSILQYYSERIQRKMSAIEHSNISPREKLVRQLEAQLEEILAQKEVLVLQFREQVLYMNKDIEQFFKQVNLVREKWHETRFLALYGERIRPHLLDLSRLFDGMLNAYLKLMIKHSLHLDVNQLADFIVRRLDDIVNGLLTGDEKPILTKELLTSAAKKLDTLKQTISQLLMKMEKELQPLELNDNRKQELQDTLHFLSAEIKKDEPKKFIFKGMLANFDDIEILQPYKAEIADMMEIQE